MQIVIPAYVNIRIEFEMKNTYLLRYSADSDIEGKP